MHKKYDAHPDSPLQRSTNNPSVGSGITEISSSSSSLQPIHHKDVVRGRQLQKSQSRFADPQKKAIHTFSPTPPAFKLMINTFGLREGARNSETVAFRFLISIEPSNLEKSKRSRCKTISMRSRKLVNCENTTARKHGSWSRSRPMRHW
jgi:hypothetical protein